jgi:hypothetical protein
MDALVAVTKPLRLTVAKRMAIAHALNNGIDLTGRGCGTLVRWIAGGNVIGILIGGCTGCSTRFASEERVPLVVDTSGQEVCGTVL